MFGEDGEEIEKGDELSYSDCIKVIDDLAAVAKRWDMSGFIAWSGGDPILRSDFFDLLRYARKHRLGQVILGNPFHLTEEVVRDLDCIGIKRYQISVDGLSEAHDSLRKRGSFNAAIEAIRLLQKTRIKTAIMFTLSRENIHELPSVITLAAEMGVDYFSFNRCVPIGNGRELQKIEGMLSPGEYRETLLRSLVLYEKYEREESKTRFIRKDPLFKLLLWERGALEIVKQDTLSGCGMCRTKLSLLSNGVILPCRRIFKSIGKLPQQKLKDIILTSPLLKQVNDTDNFQKCRWCELKMVCRGCPAVSWGSSGDIFGEDPQCWKIIKKHQKMRLKKRKGEKDEKREKAQEQKECQ
jgi:radical SAM protein with 4Fe4S-binding SPASM domain